MSKTASDAEPTIEQNVYYQIGYFLSQFTAIEHFLKTFLLDIIGADRACGMFLVQKLDAGALIAKARHAARQRQKYSANLKALLDAANDLRKIRNQIAHSPPAVEKDYSVLYLMGFGGKIDGKNEPHTVMPCAYIDACAKYAFLMEFEVTHLGRQKDGSVNLEPSGLLTAALPSPPSLARFDPENPHTTPEDILELFEQARSDLLARFRKEAPRASAPAEPG